MSNVFSFTGSCGRDAEIKYLPSGQAVLTVAVANSVGFGDKKTTIWVRVTLWGKRGETLVQYLKKGQSVFVSGELTLNEYTGNDGVKKTMLEINANIIDLVGKKNDSSQSAPAPAQQPQQQGYPPPRPAQNSGAAYQAAQNGAAYDDDIPF
jgi:single-strand DNA-binding protein